MSLKKTACLAALLTSLPLAAPAASVPWDDNESHDRVDRDGVWVVVSSGTSESELREQVFPVDGTASAVYDKVYITWIIMIHSILFKKQ